MADDTALTDYVKAREEANSPYGIAKARRESEQAAMAEDVKTAAARELKSEYPVGPGITQYNYPQAANDGNLPEKGAPAEQFDPRYAVAPDPRTLDEKTTDYHLPHLMAQLGVSAEAPPLPTESEAKNPMGLPPEDLGNMILTRDAYNMFAKMGQEAVDFAYDITGVRAKPPTVPKIGAEMPMGVTIPISEGEQFATDMGSLVLANLALRRVSPQLAGRMTKELVADTLTGAMFMNPAKGETALSPKILTWAQDKLGIEHGEIQQALTSGSTDALTGRVMNAIEFGPALHGLMKLGKLTYSAAEGIAQGLVALAKGEIKGTTAGMGAAEGGWVGNKTVATRVPKALTEQQVAKGKTRESALTDPSFRTDIDAMKGSPEAFKKNVDLFDTYATSFKVDPALPTEQKAQQIVRDLADNLLWLHDAMPAALRDRAKQWYVGANKLTKALAEANGLAHEQAAGVTAVLSPKMDWFKNMDQAKRVMEIHPVGVASKWRATPAMKKWVAQFAERAEKPEVATLLNTTANDPIQKAYWIRAYDETMNARGYDILSPEGEVIGPATNISGSEAVSAWQSFGAISKAVRIIEDGSFENISKNLGNEHKVRNFFNNIIDPTDATSVTIDTHAVAAGLLRALSGNSTEVTHNFGGTGAAGAAVETGASGTYGIYHDAYALAAQERGILPREMQSITWEAVRGLFDKSAKGQGLDKDIQAIWKQVQDGTLSKGEGLDAVVELSGGITPPSWSEGGTVYHGTQAPDFELGKMKTPAYFSDTPSESPDAWANLLESEGAVIGSPRIIPAKLDMKKPYDMTKGELLFKGRSIDPEMINDAAIAFLKSKGYDGIKYQMSAGPGGHVTETVYIAFDPQQIRSAIGKGK